MSVDVDINLDVKGDAGKLAKDLDKGFKDADRSAKGFGLSLNSLSGAMGPLVAAASTFAASFTLGKLIESANKQEDAVNKLNSALLISGDYSAAASKDLQNFASNLQQVTKFGDETTLEMLSLAKAFGATNEEAKKVVTAAADLSVAASISLTEATRRIGRTFSGSIDDVSKFATSIKGLTKEQLASGQAADELIKSIGGAAQAELNTFSGAATKTANAFGDLLEEIGFYITKNPLVIDSIKKQGESWVDLAKTISGYRSIFTKNTITMNSMVDQLANSTAKGIAKTQNFFSKLFGGQDRSKLIEEAFNQSANKIDMELNKELDLFIASEEAKTNAVKNALKERNDIYASANKANYEKLRSAQEEYSKWLKEEQKKEAERIRGIAVQGFAGLTSGIAGGRIGGGNLITSGLSLGAESAFAGAGSIVSPLAQALGSQSDTEVQMMVKGFAEGAVVFAENLINNIPVLIDSLIQQLPLLIENFAGLMPQVINVLVANAPDIITALIKETPRMAVAFGNAMIDGADGFIDALVDGAGEVVQAIIDGLKSGIKSSLSFSEGGSLVDFAKTSFAGQFLGGGPGSVIAPVTNVFKKFGKFSDGGMVPEGYPNDNFPSLLTSGERVLSVKTNEGLEESIKYNNDTLSKIVNLISQPQVVSSSVEVNGQAFAEILLNLSRTGARTVF